MRPMSADELADYHQQDMEAEFAKPRRCRVCGQMSGHDYLCGVQDEEAPEPDEPEDEDEC